MGTKTTKSTLRKTNVNPNSNSSSNINSNHITQDNPTTPTRSLGRLLIYQSENPRRPTTTISFPGNVRNVQRSLSDHRLQTYGNNNNNNNSNVADPTSLKFIPVVPVAQPNFNTFDATETTTLVAAKEYQSTSPPISQWILPALLCALAYAFYNIFIKLGSYSIQPVLGGVLLQFVAALLGLVLLLLQLSMQQKSLNEMKLEEGDDANEPLSSSSLSLFRFNYTGMAWSMGAGVAVGLAEMLSFFVSSQGVPAVQSIPVIIGGSVVCGTVLGYLFLDETLTWRGWLGVGLVLCGICMVGMD